MANRSHMTSEKRKPKASEKNKPAKTIASAVVQPELVKKQRKVKPPAE